MNAAVESPENNISVFQIIVLILSVIVLGTMVTEAVKPLPKEASGLLQKLDNAVCAVFLLGFVIRYRQAKDKRAFMKWGWIDLLASIPNVEFLRWGRMVRVLRIIRLLRGVRSFQKVYAVLLRDRVKNGLALVATIAGLLVIFGSVGVLLCERDADGNIKTAEDAIWWSVTTMTTVGYGDKYPVTTEGRVVAMVLMVSGMGLFGSMSGLLASYFLGSKQEEPNDQIEKLAAEIRVLHQKIDELTRKR